MLNDGEAKRAEAYLTKHAANSDTAWLKQKYPEAEDCC